MVSITKIEMNGTLIEEKEGQIYINGKHLETGKPSGLDFCRAMAIGAFIGISIFASLLLSIEFLAKGLSV